MYVPPAIEPKAGLIKNQILFERLMADALQIEPGQKVRGSVEQWGEGVTSQMAAAWQIQPGQKVRRCMGKCASEESGPLCGTVWGRCDLESCCALASLPTPLILPRFPHLSRCWRLGAGGAASPTKWRPTRART